MSINTACISLDRYLELLENEKQLQKMAKMLEDTIEPLAEYKSICLWFGDCPVERKLYDEWLQNEWMQSQPEQVAKASKDCLTAMAEVSWHDCFKAVNAE